MRRAGKIMGMTVATFLITAAIAAVMMYAVCRFVPLERNPKPTSGDWVSLVLEHGKAPKGASYEYAVLPRTDAVFWSDDYDLYNKKLNSLIYSISNTLDNGDINFKNKFRLKSVSYTHLH